MVLFAAPIQREEILRSMGFPSSPEEGGRARELVKRLEIRLLGRGPWVCPNLMEREVAGRM